jgi:malonyl-CoA O-methyltransferase
MDRLRNEENGLVLEIGAGGGFVFEEFLRRQKKYRNYLALDISEKMLRLAPKKGLHKIRADGEELPFSSPVFDTLLSSSTMQWFSAPEKSIPECLRLVKSGGCFSLAFFVAGTFPEMARAAEASGFGTVHELPRVEPCLEAVKRFCPDVEHGTSERAVHYPNPLAFLKSHKQTGATWTKGPKRANKKGLKDFCAFYAENFRDQEGGVIATYKILYLSGKIN